MSIRRKPGYLAFVVMTIFAFFVAACGGDSSTSVPESQSESNDSPKQGGTLSFSRNFETQSLDPMGSAENGSIFVRVQIFDTLVSADPETEPEVGPGLAESWEVSDDGLSWTFHLRQAKFSNGDPLTAEDVKFSIERFADSTINVNIPSLGDGIIGVDIIDPETVKINLDRQVGALLTNLSVFPASIVNKKLVEAEGDKHWDNPVGTGPFKLKEWVLGSHLVLERNSFYWEKGQPYLDEVRFDFVPDDNARVIRIQSGDADIIEGLPWAQIEQLSGQSDFKVQTDEIVRYETVFINHTKGSLGELKVRQALNYAVDKESILKTVYGGVGTVANSMIPKAKYHDDNVPAYSFDLEKAKVLMSESSTPYGFEMNLVYAAGAEHLKQLATVLQSQWAKIGVKLVLEQMDAGALWTSRFATMDYEAAIPLPKFTSDVNVPDEVALLFYDDNPENSMGGFLSGWKISKNLIDLTRQASFTMDETQRAKLWPEVQAVAMQEAPWVTLFFLPSVHGVKNDVRGFRVLSQGWWDLEDVWLDR